MTGEAQAGIAAILATGPVVPVIVVDDARSAVPLGRALVAGGLRVLEITLRTPAALEALRAIAGDVAGAICGVGTVLDRKQLEASAAAGARFAVAPGATEALLDAAADSAVPLLPGAATVSEMMRLQERGYRFQKFFPAEAAGGAALLHSVASPLPAIVFCPTGGITPEKAPAYLRLANVACVGGSWMLPKAAIAAGDFGAIEALARAAARLGG